MKPERSHKALPAETVNTEPYSKHLKCKCTLYSNNTGNEKLVSRVLEYPQRPCLHLPVVSRSPLKDTMKCRVLAKC